MDWNQSHPRRIPSSEEMKDNKRIIAELDRKITSLQAELTALLRERERRASFLAPFRRLPTEILCEIVQYSRDAGVSLFVLNQINSTLREAVNGMSFLWNWLHLSPRHSATVSS